jgi:hypothetical protein
MTAPTIRYYRCTRCERHHWQDEALFRPHVGYQERQGERRVGLAHGEAEILRKKLDEDDKDRDEKNS